MKIASVKAVASHLKDPYLILSRAHEVAADFLRVFLRLKQSRTGTTTDQEQDMLRAMLVFASAGVDGMMKHIIRSSLPKLSEDALAMGKLNQFVSRRIKAKLDKEDSKEAAEFLAGIVTSKSTKAFLIADYISDLTAGSLQSSEELSKAIAALGFSEGDLIVDRVKLKGIFDDRNKIVHELDVDFSQPNRKRKSRKAEQMISNVNYLLDLGEKILRIVDKKTAGQ